MKIKTLYALLFLFVLTSTTNSCRNTGAAAKRITVKSGQIPPDMEIEDFTLIGILQNQESYDKHVEKKFSDYTGKYVLATKEEIDTKYKDIVKYRYILDCTVERTKVLLSAGSKDTYNRVEYRYYLRDRKTNRKYTRKTSSGLFPLEIEAYLKAIEAVRKQ